MRFNPPIRRAFSLTEVVIALGVFAFVIVSNYALFGLSINEIRQVSDRDSAVRAAGALQNGLRQKPWADVFNWVAQGRSVMVYNYKASLTAKRSDGTPSPYTGVGVAGKDYQVTGGMRFTDDPELANDDRARDGSLFLARLQVSAANPIIPLADLATYDAGLLVIKAELFEAPKATMTAPPAGAKPLYTSTITYLR
jgi:hypothetical protein